MSIIVKPKKVMKQVESIEDFYICQTCNLEFDNSDDASEHYLTHYYSTKIDRYYKFESEDDAKVFLSNYPLLNGDFSGVVEWQGVGWYYIYSTIGHGSFNSQYSISNLRHVNVLHTQNLAKIKQLKDENDFIEGLV